MATTPQATESAPEVSVRTPCDLGNTPLTSCIKVRASIQFYQQFNSTDLQIYSSNVTLESDPSDKDSSNYSCSDHSEEAEESDKEGDLTLAATGVDNGRVLQDLEYAGE